MAGVSTSFAIQDRMTGKFDKMTAANDRLNRAMEITDQMTHEIDLDSAYRSAASAIDEAADNTENLNQKQQRTETGAKKVANAWEQAYSAIKKAVTAMGVKKVIDLADTMTQTTARLNLMNDGLQTTAQLQDKILASANRSRAAYQTTADMVSKLGMQAGDAFKSNDELIAFAEQLNKTFVIAGTDATGVESTMYNLTQALSSGVLRGQDLNAVMSNAMPIVKNIAEYLGVSVGEIRNMATEGELSATVVKNAMLAAAEQTNATFQQIPMTFGQVATVTSNVLLQTFQPVIQMIGQGAQWIYDNWSTIAPVFWGIAAAAGAYLFVTKGIALWNAINTAGTVAYNVALMAKSIAMGIVAIATGNAALAQQALNTAMLTSPIGWIMLAIAALIIWIYKLVQSVGGLKIAWLIVCNAILTAWDWVKIGFMTGVYWVMDLFNKLQLAFATVGTNIANFMGDMKANVLMILQNMVNGAIDIINGFIKILNKIPGVNIGLIEQVSFGTTAQLENEAAKQARDASLDAYRDQIEAQIADRDNSLNQMKEAARAATAARDTEIAAAKAAKAQEDANANAESTFPYDPYSGSLDSVDEVGEVGKIKDDVNIAEEDLKFLRDVAEMRYTQNLVTLTPQVVLSGVQISERVDIDDVVNRIESRLEDEFVAAAEGVYN